MINVDGLVKTYGSLTAVDNISFSVPKGQVLGFLGPNGAGKTTTMKVLTCFIQPDSGTVTVGGKSIYEESIEVRKQIGYLPENSPTYAEMTVKEFLEFIAEMRGFRGKKRIVAAEAMQDTCFLNKVWNQPIETLSRGYRQRVGLAQALIHNPPVLILDEPTDGLDPNQKHEVRSLIKQMGKDKTIILSTHILEEVEAVCERVIIISEGKLVADATPLELMLKSELANAITLTFSENTTDQYVPVLQKINGVSRVEMLDIPGTLRVFPNDGKLLAEEISKVVRESKWPIQQIFVERGRLDEVFRKITIRN